MAYALGPEQFVDYLIERRGLIDFVQLQLRGEPEAQWTQEQWQTVTGLIWHLSEGMWTPSVAYVIDLYMMQKERHQFWEQSTTAAHEKWKARCEMWKARALSAEAALASPKGRRKAVA